MNATLATLVHKHAHATLKSISPDQREFSFIATRYEVDRDGEVIDQEGLDVRDFRKNPVLLMLHDPNRPIGRVVSLTRSLIDGAWAWIGIGRIDPPGTSDDADQAYRRLKAGSLNGISISFRVLESSPRAVLSGQTGPTYTKTTLLEISLVTIPSCANCLVLEKTLQKETAMNCNCQTQEIDWDSINRERNDRVEVDVSRDDVMRVIDAVVPRLVAAGLSAVATEAATTAMRRLTGRLD